MTKGEREREKEERVGRPLTVVVVEERVFLSPCSKIARTRRIISTNNRGCARYGIERRNSRWSTTSLGEVDGAGWTCRGEGSRRT